MLVKHEKATQSWLGPLNTKCADSGLDKSRDARHCCPKNDSLLCACCLYTAAICRLRSTSSELSLSFSSRNLSNSCPSSFRIESCAFSSRNLANSRPPSCLCWAKARYSKSFSLSRALIWYFRLLTKGPSGSNVLSWAVLRDLVNNSKDRKC